MRNSSAQGSLLCILVALVVIISINILRLEGVDARSNKTLSIKVEKVGTDYGGSTPFYVVNLPIGSPNQTTMRLKLDLDSSETIVNCSNELAASSRTLHKLKCRDKRSRKSNENTLEGCEVEDSVWLNELRGNVSDPTVSVSVPVRKVNFECVSNADGVAAFSGAAASSLPAQVSKNGPGIGKRFSYCLPSIAYFGSPDVYTKAQVISVSFSTYKYVQITHFSSNQFQRTPLIIKKKKKKKNGPEPKHRYAISVHNISVDGNGWVGSLNLSKPIELFISTTQLYTSLETSTYVAFRDMFRHAVGPAPPLDPVAPFDTCYSANSFFDHFGGQHPLPIGPFLSLNLAGGATWTVSAPKYFVRPSSKPGVACFGFVDAGPNKPNVLGTFQQEDSLLEFDVARSTLAFQRIYVPDTSERFLTGCRHLL